MALFNFFKSTIKTIEPGDKMFKIHNGFMSSDRASIRIDPRCPRYVAEMVVDAYNSGWIKPVAHVTEKEYTLLGLSQE